MYASMAMFIITAVVAYAAPMFFSNALGPVRIIHMLNISSIDMVNSTLIILLIAPDAITKIMYKSIAFVGRANVQLVNLEIHFVLVITDGFLSCLFGMKYPGNHNMSKPNGIEQMIFHNGMPIVRARKKQAHSPIIVIPNMYKETNTNNEVNAKPMNKPT